VPRSVPSVEEAAVKGGALAEELDELVDVDLVRAPGGEVVV